MGKPRLTMLKQTLTTLLPQVSSAPLARARDVQRLRGRRLQQRRERWLRLHPLCGDRIGGPSPEHSACVRAGRVSPGQQVDHIQPLSMGGCDEQGNWQSLCTACHAAKTAAEATNRARGSST